MAPSFEIPVTVGGMLAAIAFVVAGGPVFAFGLRALRLRRSFARLRSEALTSDCRGLVLVDGVVALESPLFAPLSQQPCAGFTLAVEAEGTRIGGTVRQQRAFRLNGAQGDARVEAAHGLWQLPVSAERSIAAGEALSERVDALFETSSELRWLRRSGYRLRLREHALLPQARVHVLAQASVVESEAMLGEDVVQRTGTDEAAVIAHAAPADATELVLGGDDPFVPCVVSASEPQVASLVPPLWHVAGALLGPAVTMAGLLYLAHAAEVLMAGRT